jgi:hypothetical protein
MNGTNTEMQSMFDEIYDSIVNGQRAQAVRQMQAMGLHHMYAMLDYFTHDLDQPEMAIDAAKSYFFITTQ